jgi:cytochrome c-type biogenesis protein CcmE
MKPKHQRLIFITVSVIFLCIAVLLSLRAFRDNLIFFYSPSEAAQQHIDPNRLVRLGGLVKAGSIKHSENNRTQFIITDGATDISVTYQGMLPDLFRDGQGVIAEGYVKGGTFEAKTILAKHDEKYMPKEVVDALKKSGRWKGE